MKRVFILFALLLTTDSPAWAVPAPETIHFQGVLRDAAGAPRDGTFDMTFRLYDVAVGGVALYTDAHLAAGTGAVSVSGGLFSVAIGTGDHNNASLAQVFADHIDVWVEIEIGGETLSPRVQVHSSGHALNAGNADLFAGLGTSSFLRSDQDSSTSGAITAQQIRSRGDLFANHDGPDGDSFLYFFDGTQTARFLKWNDLLGRFETSSRLHAPALESPVIDANDLRVYDDLYFNWNGPNGDAYLYFHNNGSNTAESIRWNDFADLFQISTSTIVDGVLEAYDEVRAGDDIRVNFQGPDGDSTVYFYDNGSSTGQSIRWNNFVEAFEVSTSMVVHGILEADDRVRVGGDLAVEGQQIAISNRGPNQNQDIEFYHDQPQFERFQWDDAAERFEVSDDFHAFGNVSASGSKNFVQNHPHRDDLEIVYTALEGNEVTTFTRGSGRLVGGEASIELEESFRFVTNPEIGLTATVTPRGGPATLYVAALSTEELIVQGDDDVPFDFVVHGLRIGYEDFPVYRPKRAESFVPPVGSFEEEFASEPALADHTASSRYRAMEASALGRSIDGMPAAMALREAIGMREPGRDYPRGSELSVAELNQRALAAEKAGGAPGEQGPSTGRESAGSGSIDAPPTPDDGSAAVPPLPASATSLVSLAVASERVEPGDVLVIDPRTPGGALLGRHEAETAVFGVVTSLNPAESDVAASQVPVVVGGVALCKVDAGWGAIRPGDLLQTSPTPGHAMRADEPRPGAILGKALEPLDAGTGSIRVLVTLR